MNILKILIKTYLKLIQERKRKKQSITFLI